MALVEDDDVIQAFSADRTDETLSVRVLPGRSQNGLLMLKSDKLEFERGAAAKTGNQDRYNGEENRHH